MEYRMDIASSVKDLSSLSQLAAPNQKHFKRLLVFLSEDQMHPEVDWMSCHIAHNPSSYTLPKTFCLAPSPKCSPIVFALSAEMTCGNPS